MECSEYNRVKSKPKENWKKKQIQTDNDFEALNEEAEA